MKKISIVYFAGILFFAACNNPNSASVGDWSKEESTEHSEQKEEHSGTTQESTSDSTFSGETGTGVKSQPGADTSASATGVEPK